MKKENMNWFKSFQKQGIECRKTGNQFEISSGYAPDNRFNVIVCVPFKTYCHSKACGDIRQAEGVSMNIDSEKWIYESPDGGKTIYRRPFGNYNYPREQITEKGPWR